MPGGQSQVAIATDVESGEGGGVLGGDVAGDLLVRGRRQSSRATAGGSSRVGRTGILDLTNVGVRRIHPGIRTAAKEGSLVEVAHGLGHLKLVISAVGATGGDKVGGRTRAAGAGAKGQGGDVGARSACISRLDGAVARREDQRPHALGTAGCLLNVKRARAAEGQGIARGAVEGADRAVADLERAVLHRDETSDRVGTGENLRAAPDLGQDAGGAENVPLKGARAGVVRPEGEGLGTDDADMATRASATAQGTDDVARRIQVEERPGGIGERDGRKWAKGVGRACLDGASIDRGRARVNLHARQLEQTRAVLGESTVLDRSHHIQSNQCPAIRVSTFGVGIDSDRAGRTTETQIAPVSRHTDHRHHRHVRWGGGDVARERQGAAEVDSRHSRATIAIEDEPGQGVVAEQGQRRAAVEGRDVAGADLALANRHDGLGVVQDQAFGGIGCIGNRNRGARIIEGQNGDNSRPAVDHRASRVVVGRASQTDRWIAPVAVATQDEHVASGDLRVDRDPAPAVVPSVEEQFRGSAGQHSAHRGGSDAVRLHVRIHAGGQGQQVIRPSKGNVVGRGVHGVDRLATAGDGAVQRQLYIGCRRCAGQGNRGARGVIGRKAHRSQSSKTQP